MSTEVTSPRKRALMPTGDLRRQLRAHGHALKPLVQIGKSGVTPGVLAQVAQALFDHELVKVRIGTECPVDRFDVADELAAQPGTKVVQILGRIVLVYKRHPEKPRFEGKGAREARGEGGEGKGPRRPAGRGKGARGEGGEGKGPRRPGRRGKGAREGAASDGGGRRTFKPARRSKR